MSVSLTDFRYRLPEELIALYPATERSASRLLCLDGTSGAMGHRVFRQLPELLRGGDLLVFNDTRVIPARLFGRKRDSGGRVEILVERLLSTQSLLAQLRASRAPRPGTGIVVEDCSGDEVAELTVDARTEQFYRMSLKGGNLMELLEEHGHMPLPPYIARRDERLDQERYQTIYAAQPGAVAAPTAGLHFEQALLDDLSSRGVAQLHVTLHVGAGTFQPVRCERIQEHRMHAEFINVNQSVCDAVIETHRSGGRVIAVGTTSVRCLETAALGGNMKPYCGDTDIFIYPPYRFQTIDAMITNFHLPESTLLMLVSAFAGREKILAAYMEAINRHYRFFSYGDAMFITAAEAPLLKHRSAG